MKGSKQIILSSQSSSSDLDNLNNSPVIDHSRILSTNSTLEEKGVNTKHVTGEGEKEARNQLHVTSPHRGITKSKQLKAHLKMLRKTERHIPLISEMISTCAKTIEEQCGKFIHISNKKYN